MWKISLAGVLAFGLWMGLSMNASLAAPAPRQASAFNQASNPYVALQVATIVKMHDEIINADYSHCRKLFLNLCPASQIRITSAAWKSVPDGTGGTVYGWLLSGGGNAPWFWIAFFDNSHYIGQSSTGVLSYSPVGIGKFSLKYHESRVNDPICCPSGPWITRVYQYNTGRRTMVLVSPAHQAPSVAHHPPAANPHAYTDRSTGMTLTINKAIKDAKGSGFSHPRSGYLFVALYITIRNASGSNHSYNPFDLTLVDNRGQTFDPTALLPDAYTPEIHSGTMPAHQFRAGWTGFEIPTSTKYADVYWDDGSRLDPPARVTRYTV